VRTFVIAVPQETTSSYWTEASGRNSHWRQKELEVFVSLHATCRNRLPASLPKNRTIFFTVCIAGW